MHLTALFCLHSGALIRSAYGDHHTHESRLFRQLWEALESNDVLVGDRGFVSFGSVAGPKTRGVESLLRLPERKLRQAISAQLPKAACFDVVVTWKRPAKCPPGMESEDFVQLPESLEVRVVRYAVAAKGFRTEYVTLVTTLLSPEIPASDLAELYFKRWGVELHFREIKVQLNMDVLLCKSPHMIERELRMHFIACNLIRCVMQKAAVTGGVDLRRISFKGTLDTVRQFASALCGAEDKPRTVAAIIEEMLSTIARDLLPHRPNRSEPRVRKRRPKNYRLLTKPRREMGPLPHRKIGVERNPKSSLS